MQISKTASEYIPHASVGIGDQIYKSLWINK